jgi:hypothetical protein
MLTMDATLHICKKTAIKTGKPFSVKSDDRKKKEKKLMKRRGMSVACNIFFSVAQLYFFICINMGPNGTRCARCHLRAQECPGPPHWPK